MAKKRKKSARKTRRKSKPARKARKSAPKRKAPKQAKRGGVLAALATLIGTLGATEALRRKLSRRSPLDNE
jgi:hypothetical protein